MSFTIHALKGPLDCLRPGKSAGATQIPKADFYIKTWLQDILIYIFSQIQPFSGTGGKSAWTIIMANWFAAFRVDGDDWFKSVISHFPATIKPFQPADLHMTLAFFGKIDTATESRIIEEISKVRLPSFTATADKIILLPRENHFTAVSLHLELDQPELAEMLQTNRNKLLETAGCKPDARNFLPHITLGRPLRKISGQKIHLKGDFIRTFPMFNIELNFIDLCLYTWSDNRTISQFTIVYRKILDFKDYY